MRKILFILCLVANSFFQTKAQSMHGVAWVNGGGGILRVTRFNLDNSRTQYYLGTPPDSVWFAQGHSNICDSAGRLLLLSDGYNLYDSTLQYIDGGKKLCFDSLYNLGTGTVCSESQTSIILPLGNDSYYMINSLFSDSCILYGASLNWTLDYLLYHKVDMKANNGAGKVVKRMQVLDKGRFQTCAMTACRHANGKDWWLFKLGGDSITLHKYLVTQDSIYNKGQEIFPGLPGTTFGALNGQLMFNPDGSKLMCVSRLSDRVYQFDFNRCTGIISQASYVNAASDTLIDPAIEGGCYSPNGRYIYIAKYYHIWQYDTQDPDSNTAWYRVAGLDTVWQAFQSYSNVFPGPDGRVYIGNWNGLSNQMSVINKPNEKGINCEWCPRCLRFDTVFNYAGISQPPNMPNYGLGMDSSLCWPLANEEPIMKNDELVVYPNPASTSITISCEALIGKRVKVSLYNKLGQAMMSQECHFVQQKSNLDISFLPSGVYLLKVGEWVRRVVVE